MTESDKTRIETAADEYVKQFLPYVDTTGHWIGFIDGAHAEHTRAWNAAVDECITKIDDLIDQEYLELGSRCSYSVFKKTLE